MSSSAEINALGSTTVVDFYRPSAPECDRRSLPARLKIAHRRPGRSRHFFRALASLVENLISAEYSRLIFYGSILGIFLVAFFLRFVRGSAVFAAALVSQALVLILFYSTKIGYLWYNALGCVAVLMLSALLEKTLFRARRLA
jgi:hypothetical protein